MNQDLLRDRPAAAADLANLLAKHQIIDLCIGDGDSAKVIAIQCRARGCEFSSDNVSDWSVAHHQADLALSWFTDWVTKHDLRVQVETLRETADLIQALHPGEVKNSVVFLRDQADLIEAGQ